MKRLLSCIPLLLLSVIAAIAGQEPLVRMDDVKRAAMLLKTSQPGVYAEAPAIETDVRLHVRGIVLRGEVTQTFENTTPQCAEAVYVFPLPENAAVDTLRMTIGQRVIEGEIQEKKQAQQTYDTAKSEGKHASLLTQERPNIFTVAIANVASGEKVRIDIGYQQTVDYRDGLFSLRFPMTIGPRYIPKGVSDAERITPQAEIGRNKTSLTVDVDAGFSLKHVDSRYHSIRTSVVSGSHYVVMLDGGKKIPADHDFELTWQPDLGNEPKSALFNEGDYALMMMIMPPAQTSVRLPRETVFVIDTSGSMEGTSINEAKHALLLALDRLQSGDRFNVIEFNSVTHILFDDAQPATSDAISRAKTWVNDLHANGGTEILDALQHALSDAHATDDGVRQVVFMTDGQVGNEDQCFAWIREHLGRTRLFTVGIGAAPNSHFMRNAARFGRGTFTYIGNVSEVQEKMGGLFEKLENPVLTNVTLHLDDPAAEVWPQRVPDLYSGEPVVVTVKSAKRGGRLIATATMGKEPWNSTQVFGDGSEGSGIAKLWARQKIEALLDRDGALAENSADRQQIIDLALASHLVTPLTSLVAVDHTPTGVNPATCNTTAIPVNLPAGWGGIDTTLPQTATPGPLMIAIAALLLLLAVAVAKV
jgi:Ca-activated chloride channel family protein